MRSPRRIPVEHFLQFPNVEAIRGLKKSKFPPLHLEEDQAMAQQRTTGSEGTSPIQEVSAHVSETARQVGETASQYYDQGREQLEDVAQALEENIRAKPLQSVLLATGIGLLLGLLWKK
jgi:ElaB/YqjD/DUF883 family membrane-anchored ribosome-binding protein